VGYSNINIDPEIPWLYKKVISELVLGQKTPEKLWVTTCLKPNPGLTFNPMFFLSPEVSFELLIGPKLVLFSGSILPNSNVFIQPL
jgi:hypothetical protein